jgi:hypothetical protein
MRHVATFLSMIGNDISNKEKCQHPHPGRAVHYKEKDEKIPVL